MNVVWDTIEGASVEIAAGVQSIVRTGTVTDIDAAATADPYVLLRAMEAALTGAGQAAPGLPRAFLHGLMVKPTKGTNQARFEATYEAPHTDPGQGRLIRWYIQDDSSLQNETTQIDLLGEPLHTRYTPPAAAQTAAGKNARGLTIMTSSSGEPDYKPYPFQLNPLRPRRVISVQGYVTQRPGVSALDALGCVNDRNWPAGSLFADDKPKRKGAWLCTHVSADIERYGISAVPAKVQLYKVEARFMAKGKGANGKDRDWSDFGVHRDITGRIPKDMTTKDQVEKVRKLLESDYSVSQDHSVNGYTKVGLFWTADLNKAFGF